MGLTELLEHKDVRETCFDIVFDAGLKYLYILKMIPFSHDWDLVHYFLMSDKIVIKRNSTSAELRKALATEHQRLPKRKGRLTNTELKIIKMLLRGLPPCRIAKVCAVSEKTISAHKINAFKKLELSGMADFLRTLDAWVKFH